MRTTQALPLMSAHGKKENRCRDHPHKEKPERDWTGTCQWGKQAGENQHRGLTGMNKIELENSDPLGKQSYRLRRQKNRTKRRNEDWVPAPLGRENQGRTRPRTKIAATNQSREKQERDQGRAIDSRKNQRSGHYLPRITLLLPWPELPTRLNQDDTYA
jgi:hypothetical protein